MVGMAFRLTFRISILAWWARPLHCALLHWGFGPTFWGFLRVVKHLIYSIQGYELIFISFKKHLLCFRILKFFDLLIRLGMIKVKFREAICKHSLKRIRWFLVKIHSCLISCYLSCYLNLRHLLKLFLKELLIVFFISSQIGYPNAWPFGRPTVRFFDLFLILNHLAWWLLHLMTHRALWVFLAFWIRLLFTSEEVEPELILARWLRRLIVVLHLLR